MLLHTFNELWTIHYPNSPPLSYILRQWYPEQWLRIHSLPESKRYPETRADWVILLERHFTVLHDVFGNATDAFLVSGYYTADDKPELEQFLEIVPVFSQLSFHALPETKPGVDPSEPDDTSTYWPLVSSLKLTYSFVEKLFK